MVLNIIESNRLTAYAMLCKRNRWHNDGNPGHTESFIDEKGVTFKFFIHSDAEAWQLVKWDDIPQEHIKAKCE